MEPIHYLRAFRRRWYLVPAALIVSLLAAFFASDKIGNTKSVTYEAKAVLLSTGAPLGGNGITRLKTVAALVAVGEVPVRVAKTLNHKGDPLTLAKKIEVIVDEEVGTIRIIGKDRKPDVAASVANAYSRELIIFLIESIDRTKAFQLEELSKKLAEFQGEITRLDQQSQAVKGPQSLILQAERDATIRRYGVVFEQYQVIAQKSGTAPLQIVAEGIAEPAEARGLVLPSSREARLVIALVLGLILGLVLILVLERFDSRIRTKRAAEQHFDLPVLAEIPSIRRRDRKRPATTPDGSVASDSFRILAAEMSRAAAEGPSIDGNGHKKAGARTILVTSAGPAEGKTTVVANLGVALSKVGKKVILLSCDFRRPSLHRLFKVSGEPGIAEALATANGSLLLPSYLQGTQLEDVAIVAAGAHEMRAGDLLGTEAMRRLLDEAAAMGDVVIIDSAPVLASDTAHLVPEADAILVVARAGVTTPEMAERTSEVLKRLGSKVVGLALNCADELPAQRRYYRRAY
jgi:capsular exopolysaccharide synthesis family protein